MIQLSGEPGFYNWDSSLKHYWWPWHSWTSSRSCFCLYACNASCQGQRWSLTQIWQVSYARQASSRMFMSMVLTNGHVPGWHKAKAYSGSTGMPLLACSLMKVPRRSAFHSFGNPETCSERLRQQSHVVHCTCQGGVRETIVIC